MSTNPFLSSSPRQPTLIPKELFPGGSSRQQQFHQPQHLTDDDTSMMPSTIRRPVKLPLRKHHSFHFQPSQTVAGAMKQTKNRYKNNGPLVFKPFNEKSAFKPITPVPKSSTQTGELGTVLSSDTATMNSDHKSGGNGNDHVHSISTTVAPRICGTSLKRHISNVETYNRSRSIDETNSMSDDEDSVTPPSSSSASNGRGKRLHYADLAPLCASITSASNTNSNSINSSSRNNNVNNNNRSKINNNNTNNNNDNNNGSASNSSSCTISSSDNKIAIDANPNGLNRSSASANGHQPSHSNGSLPIKRTTQYATLKFNEVNI